MSRVDYCITTMDRPDALARLLLSIAVHRPDARSIHIADQGESFDLGNYDRLADRLVEAGLNKRPTVHRLPFDCGVSAARNRLVDATTGEYKLVLDDDFVFTDRTDVDALVRLLDAYPDAGAVGGSVTRNGQIRNVGTRLERRGATLHQLVADDPLDQSEGVWFRRATCVPIFMLMRQELCARVRWDPDLKTAGEHFDFFLRVQETPYSVLHAPDVTIDHPPIEAEAKYTKLRWRGEFLKQMLVKHELTHLITLDGTVFERQPNGGLARS